MPRNFFITRVGEPGDPTAPLEFFPPKGSDELHEALKEAFPLLPNLQARMREAVIEFCMNEQREEEARQLFSPQLTNNTTPEYLPSPGSSFASALSTPSGANSLTLQGSRRQSITQPTQRDLMDVWSLPTSTQTKIHTRRNMTDEEKVKYKAKRIAGACDDCRRRRRKCDHDITKAKEGVSQAAQRKEAKQKKRIAANREAAIKAAPVPVVPSSSQYAIAMNQPARSQLPFDTTLPAHMIFDRVNDPTSFASDSQPGFNLAFPSDMDFSADWDLFPELPMTDWNEDMTNFSFAHGIDEVSPLFQNNAASMPGTADTFGPIQLPHSGLPSISEGDPVRQITLPDNPLSLGANGTCLDPILQLSNRYPQASRSNGVEGLLYSDSTSPNCLDIRTEHQNQNSSWRDMLGLTQDSGPQIATLMRKTVIQRSELEAFSLFCILGSLLFAMVHIHAIKMSPSMLLLGFVACLTTSSPHGDDAVRSVDHEVPKLEKSEPYRDAGVDNVKTETEDIDKQ